MIINHQYIISRYPVFLVLITVVHDIVKVFLVEPVRLTSEELLIYSKVSSIDKPIFLAYEVFILLMVVYMILVIASKNKEKFKFCTYHKLSVGILGTNSILNIIAIITPFDLTVYNSITAQAVMGIALIMLLWLFIRGK